MATHIWTIMQGQTGAVRTGTLSDADGAVDLSQFDSVSVIASKTASSTPVIDELVTIDPDQVANKGNFSFTFSEANAAIPVRTIGYLLAFKCMDGATPTYFPLNRRSERTYGRLVVQDPLG